jgi:hypothetical protein
MIRYISKEELISTIVDKIEDKFIKHLYDNLHETVKKQAQYRASELIEYIIAQAIFDIELYYAPDDIRIRLVNRIKVQSFIKDNELDKIEFDIPCDENVKDFPEDFPDHLKNLTEDDINELENLGSITINYEEVCSPDIPSFWTNPQPGTYIVNGKVITVSEAEEIELPMGESKK